MWINNMNSEEFEKWYAKRKAEGKKAKMKGHYKLTDDEHWVQTGHGYVAQKKKNEKK
tara:strand:- start:5 stop:175 length:171 start_codon:yes stop_codon:yes gene_type:complete